MSKALYLVSNGVTQKVKKMYTVLDGIARKVKKGYVCVAEKYRYLEYIESSGTQYINTGFKANQNTRVVIDFTYLSGDVVFGAYDSGGTNGFGLQNVSGKWYTYYGTSGGSGAAVSANVRCVVDINKNVATIDGATLRTATANTFQGGNPLLLSALFNISSANYFTSIRLYACQIYDNGTLVRDYVPCINPDGELGLLDRVEKKFYANAGTGTFAAGAEMSEVYSQSVARMFYSGDPFGGYTGAYTVSDITKDGAPYKLYTLTGSGTLTLHDAAQVWMCGGGANGTYGSFLQMSAAFGYAQSGYSGGGGGGGRTKSGELVGGEYTVTIGARAGTTTFVRTDGTTLTASAGSSGSEGSGGSGGSGGGKGTNHDKATSNGSGAGVSTYPFGITSLYAHCAGGGGGCYNGSTYGYCGGSNGSSATTKSTTGAAAGGTRGGGTGGQFFYDKPSSYHNGGNATFYGSGGGGGGAAWLESTDGNGGSGYQGVAYLLIPA